MLRFVEPGAATERARRGEHFARMGSGSVMRVRLLGPVDVMDGGEVLPVSGLRRKAVLATLALHAGQVVGTSRLVDAVWGETAPAALNTLDRKSTRLNSSHTVISYAVFCLKKKKHNRTESRTLYD